MGEKCMKITLNAKTKFHENDLISNDTIEITRGLSGQILITRTDTSTILLDAKELLMAVSILVPYEDDEKRTYAY